MLGGFSILTALVVWFLPETAGYFLDNLAISSAEERSTRRESIRASHSAISDIVAPHSVAPNKRKRAPSFRHLIEGDLAEDEPLVVISEDL